MQGFILANVLLLKKHHAELTRVQGAYCKNYFTFYYTILFIICSLRVDALMPVSEVCSEQVIHGFNLAVTLAGEV